MNSKMTTNRDYQQLNLKKKKKTKQTTEQEQNHRNGDHMEVYQQGRGDREWGKGYRE